MIGATDRDLGKMVADGRFREDLLYRLNVFPVALPPLRDRPDDIPLLVQFFASRFAARIGKRIDAVGPATLDLLVACRWPGNLRELENVIERAVILADGPELDIDPEVLAVPGVAPAVPAEPGGKSLLAVERDHILAVLRHSNWVIEGAIGAAKALGLHSNTLRSRLKKLGISRPAE